MCDSKKRLFFCFVFLFLDFALNYTIALKNVIKLFVRNFVLFRFNLQWIICVPYFIPTMPRASQYLVALWKNDTFVEFSLQVRSNVFASMFKCTFKLTSTLPNSRLSRSVIGLMLCSDEKVTLCCKSHCWRKYL